MISISLPGRWLALALPVLGCAPAASSPPPVVSVTPAPSGPASAPPPLVRPAMTPVRPTLVQPQVACIEDSQFHDVVWLVSEPAECAGSAPPPGAFQLRVFRGLHSGPLVDFALLPEALRELDERETRRRPPPAGADHDAFLLSWWGPESPVAGWSITWKSVSGQLLLPFVNLGDREPTPREVRFDLTIDGQPLRGRVPAIWRPARP